MQKVKSYENGFIANPAVMSPACTVSDLDDLKAERNISGTLRLPLLQVVAFVGDVSMTSALCLFPVIPSLCSSLLLWRWRWRWSLVMVLCLRRPVQS